MTTADDFFALGAWEIVLMLLAAGAVIAVIAAAILIALKLTGR